MSYYSRARELHENKKYDEAYKLYEQGAASGDEKCFYGIALFLQDGYFVEKDTKKAEKIFAEHFYAIYSLAESDDAEAAYIIACYYSNGFFVEKDDKIYFEWLKRSAELGYHNAQWRLGWRYYFGNDVEQNFKEAVKWYTAAAEQGNSEGQWRLGAMYFAGEGVEMNLEKAIDCFIKSAEQGNSEGQWRLGTMYQDGEGVDVDPKKAVELYKASAEQGNSTGMWHLGYMYEFGEGVEADPKKAVELYKASAQQEDSTGMWRLGYMYQYGEGVDVDLKKAVELYKASAEQEDSTGMWQLGCMYELGEGVEQSYTEAIKWYEKSAQSNNETGMYFLAQMYHYGTGIEKDLELAEKLYLDAIKTDPQDADYIHALANLYLITKNEPEKALEWYEKSVELGNPSSMCNLGYMYENGKGVEKDLSRAFDLYKKSAELGDCVGASNLGNCYKNGYGTEVDLTLAFQWLEKAANSNVNGSEFGMIKLAFMYLDGIGVEKDTKKALELFEKASSLGNTDAKNILAKLYYDGESIEQDYRKAFEYWSSVDDDNDGEHYFYLAQCYHNCRGVDFVITDESTKAQRLTKAKELYQKALDVGFNCRLAYDMVLRDLGERGSGGAMREYAEKLIQSGIRGKDLYVQIEKDLEEDFGDKWKLLKQNAKQGLISGMFYYVNTLSHGEEVYTMLDFTNVVATLSKALEIELGEFFGRGYVHFLKDVKKIPPTEYDPEKHRFVKFIESYSRTGQANMITKTTTYKIGNKEKFSKPKHGNIVYCDERNGFGFSLGSLYHLIGVEKIPLQSGSDKSIDSSDDKKALSKKAHRKVINGTQVKTIDPVMLEYARLLFREDAFENMDFDEGVINYLIDLDEDVNYIKGFRNSADHGTVVNHTHAEVCGDALIKVYRIIGNFLDKISPEYMQMSLEAPVPQMKDATLQQ